MIEYRSGFEVAVELPKGHKALGLAEVGGTVWCLAERPDGGSYWINVSNAIEPTEH